MSVKVDNIKNPIKKELGEFEGKFREAMRSRVPLLDRVMHYIVKRKGKQMRPMFVFLSAKMFGVPNERTYRAASLIELLHTATLVHDDVVDDAHMRRGFFSINAIWKNKIAVLVGDYLLSKGLLLSLDNNDFDLLKIVSNAVKEMSEGELLQIEKTRRLDIREDIYYDIIRQKTASLIASACSAGAASVLPDSDIKDKMRLCGEKIGMAFQIKDDLFDFGDVDVGKPRGIDIQEKKMTLPLIYTLNVVDKNTRKRIINTVKNHNRDKKRVTEVIDLVIANGGIQYAEKIMYQFREEALQIIDFFPANESSQAIKDLILYTTERKK